MSNRHTGRSGLKGKLALLAAGFLGLAATVARGQATVPASSLATPDGTYVPTLSFDVASIKESKPAEAFFVGGPMLPHDSRLNLTNVTALNLIEMAYGVSYSRLSGRPDWLDTVRFNIQAKSDSAADEKLAKLDDADAKLEKQHMVQGLLVDRFHLHVHWDTKQGTIYALVTAKNGPKFREAKTAPSLSGDVKDTNHHKPPPIYQRGDGRLGYELVAQGCSIKQLAGMFGGLLETVVVDKTELKDNYDFTLQYNGTNSTDPSDDATKWPPLETAIREQLGLKLEPMKGVIQILVIDHIERPSEN